MFVINRTAFTSEAYVAAEKSSREFWTVAVKGVWETGRDGKLVVASQQRPMCYADELYGEPGKSGVRYECDFVLRKPRVDVLVNGHAYGPRGRETDRVDVSLEVAGRSKSARVFGDRKWVASALGLLGFGASAPQPFLRLPLTFERAFGGVDDTHASQGAHGAEVRNLVGAGYRLNHDPRVIENTPLPNLEQPQQLMRRWSDKPEPIGFGVVGRGWRPRIGYAGTYDQAWLDNRSPFLPLDFDEHYFQAAPEDQQFDEPLEGAQVSCTNMTPDGQWTFQIPDLRMSALFVFRDSYSEQPLRLDTVLIEPDDRRVVLTWRAGVAIVKRPHDLQQVIVGNPTHRQRSAIKNGKRVFASLNEYFAWRSYGQHRLQT